MNLEQMRARLAAIVAKMEELQALSDLSDEQVTEVNDLANEFDGLKGKIEAAERMEKISADGAASARKVAPTQTTQAKVEVGVDRRTQDPKGGFKSAGEFFKAVANHGRNGSVDQRLQAGAKEAIGEDGGFLIPVDFRQDIQKKVTGDESLLSRCSLFQTGSNNLTLPTDEVAPWDGSVGIRAYWEGEGQSTTDTKPQFGESTWRLHKLMAFVRVTDELLEDSSAMECYIRNRAPEAMMHKVNSVIISGSGVGMPLGFLNSGFKYKQAKEGSQTADTFNFANANKMLGRLLPASLPYAVWLAHPALLEQIRAMKFDLSASSPVPVYMPPSGISGAPYGSLYGRPIIPMMGGVKAIGDEGDISLVDLRYYYAAIKTTGVKQDISTHVYFSTQETAFRFTQRIAGHCPYKAPVTTENGAFQMSGFVTLEDR